MKIQIIQKQCGGTEFLAQPHRLHLGAQNAAGVDELDALPGIGKVIARRIVEEREQNGPFYYPEDLMNVTGIGSRMLEKLLPLICLE